MERAEKKFTDPLPSLWLTPGLAKWSKQISHPGWISDLQPPGFGMGGGCEQSNMGVGKVCKQQRSNSSNTDKINENRQLLEKLQD